MEKTKLSCIATLLLFSILLSTMPQGTVSIVCTKPSDIPCKTTKDCPPCNEKAGFKEFKAICINNWCTCCA
ncbi:hypothetical protein Scep_025381 [Stephania cephalantha]|uniref:Uncharacterized protein n=1 Tax=Stephania cephalantha TaxID=152367 RepID=A0AAP0HR61_9MAGN